MRRLAPGAAGAFTGSVAMVSVAGVLFLTAVFLMDGRRDLSDRRCALMAASTRMSEIAVRDAAEIRGLSGEAVAVTGGCTIQLSTLVRDVPVSAREVTVAASVPSGGRVCLARRFYCIIE
jgi:hypothetical protein